jgi:hypothetical protein
MIDEIILPTEPHEPEVNANTMILYGKEKCGKTTILSQLKNALIVDSEEGTKKLKCISISVPTELGPVGKIAWLKRLGKKLKEEKKYDYIAIDTLTEINEWTEWSGTYRYMNSIMGKSFNRVKDSKGVPIKGGEFLAPDSDDYESVHTLPDGNGYRWSREDMLEIFKLFNDASRKCTIYVCHMEDKFLGIKENTDLIVPKQLALTGKLRDILPRKVDAIGYVYNDKGVIKVNFTGSEERVGGTRAKHLIGYNDVFDWDKIFI